MRHMENAGVFYNDLGDDETADIMLATGQIDIQGACCPEAMERMIGL